MSTISILAQEGIRMEGIIALTTMHCGNCGGVFAISEEFRRRREQQGGSWHCPSGGVCPCCRRHFANLGDHMRTQHPNYAEPGQASGRQA